MPLFFKRRPKASRARLWLEVLESRTLLSVYTVDRLTDLGEGAGLSGDLRYCITQATSGEDVITFGVTGTLGLTRPLPDLTHDLTIEGPGAIALTVHRVGAGQFRIFTIAASATVAISDLTIADGAPRFGSDGGGVLNQGGNVTLANLIFYNNAAAQGRGGALFVDGGTTVLTASTLDENYALNGQGGGIYVADGLVTVDSSTLLGNNAETGGGLFVAGGDVTVVNSTFVENLARGGDGGAIFAQAGATAVLSSTIFNNGSSYGGGGILIQGNSLAARNSLIAYNSAYFGPDVNGALDSLGHNLIKDSEGGQGYDATDLLDIDPVVLGLQDNGGPTMTVALRADSPAIDAGDDAADVPDWDQRGEGFPRISGAHIDIGAFEVQQDGAPHAAVQLAVALTGRIVRAPIWVEFNAGRNDSTASPRGTTDTVAVRSEPKAVSWFHHGNRQMRGEDALFEMAALALLDW